MKMFVVQHVHLLPDGAEDVKFIGVYSSELSANAAIKRLREVAGFRDCQNGFFVDCYEVNKDHWTEGFSTERQSSGP
mgnify:CR=1